MLNPEGWGDTWRMDYAATSSGLKLYEYKNSGPGADMKGRAGWTGLRVLSDNEAIDYSVQNVLAGSDGWIPAKISVSAK
jgi:pectinesterase